MGLAIDKHQAPTHQLKLYVRAVIENIYIHVIDNFSIGVGTGGGGSRGQAQQ